MTKNSYQYKVKELLLLTIALEILLGIILLFVLFIFGYFGQKTTHYLDFENPVYFYSIPFTILFSAIFILKLRKTNRYYRNSGEYLSKTVYKPNSNTNLFFRYFLFKNAIVFLLLALAQPAMGIKNFSTQSDNTQILLAVDVSNSMNVLDLSGESRLVVAKRAMNAFTQQLTGEEISLIIFANEAYQFLPYTTDYHAARMYINEIETQLISDQGTNINATLDLILKTQSKIKGISRKILILTDGEFQEKIDEKLITTIREEDIQIAMIGFGTPLGGFIPIDPKNLDAGYKTSENGVTAVSTLDQNRFNQFAKKLNAITQIIDNSFPDVFKVYAQMSEIRNNEIKNDFFVSKEQKYHIPTILAILFFVLYIAWDNTIIIRLDNYLFTKKS